MALDPVVNFGKVIVSIGYDDAAVSIVLNGGEGARLPDPGVVGAFNLTWYNSTDFPDPSDDPNREIVRCTTRSVDTLTVTRAQESTSATTKNTGGKTYKMLLAFTKKSYDEISAMVTTADESTDTTCFIAFKTDASGNLPDKTNTNLTFNANTGVLTAGKTISADITGNAATITVANEATDTTCFPTFVTDSTGSLGEKTNANLTFNSNTASLGCTTFVGALTGAASANVLKAGDSMTGALSVTSSDAANATALTVIQQDTGTSIATSITNASTGDGVIITQNGNGVALHIDNNGTANSLTIEGTTATDLVLLKSGYLGLGATPSNPLHVKGTGELITTFESSGSGNDKNVAIELKNAAGTVPFDTYLQTISTDGRFRVYNNTEALTILQNGNVGIGTASPNYNLDVNGSSAFGGATTSWSGKIVVRSDSSSTALSTTGIAAFINEDKTDNNYTLIEFAGLTADDSKRTFGKFGVQLTSHANGAQDSDFVFAPTLNGTNTERMRIRSDGNVGIGTTSPNAILQVHTGTNLNLLFTTNSSEMALSAVNDANNANVPLRIFSTTLLLSSSTSLTINSPTFLTGLGAATTGTALVITGGNEVRPLTSSKSVKHDINPIISEPNLKDLEVKSFKWNSDNVPDIGLIVEDVVNICPEIVNYKENKPYSINWFTLTALLLNKVQNLEKRIELLEKK